MIINKIDRLNSRNVTRALRHMLVLQRLVFIKGCMGRNAFGFTAQYDGILTIISSYHDSLLSRLFRSVRADGTPLGE